MADTVEMYTISSEKFGRFVRYEISDDDTEGSVAIIPDYGGMVHSLSLNLDGTLHQVLESDPTDEAILKSNFYRGAKLLPWPNRIRDGCYVFQGNTYSLPVNDPERNAALHGLLYNKRMEVLETRTDKHRGLLILGYEFDGSDPGYPFNLRVELHYRLDRGGFSCETLAENIGEQDLPFGDGWHPYFVMQKPIDELRLELPVKEEYVVDDQMIPLGRAPFHFDGSLDTVDFDKGFLVSGKGVSKLMDPKAGKSIVLSQSDAYPFLQVYTHPSRRSISIEPMSAAADAFNSRDGLVVLKPGQRWRGSYNVRLE